MNLISCMIALRIIFRVKRNVCLYYKRRMFIYENLSGVKPNHMKRNIELLLKREEIKK